MKQLDKIRDLNPHGTAEQLIYAQVQALPSQVLTKVILWCAHQLEERGRGTDP